MHATAWSVGNPHLAYAVTHGLDVARIAQRQPDDPSQNPSALRRRGASRATCRARVFYGLLSPRNRIPQDTARQTWRASDQRTALSCERSRLVLALSFCEPARTPCWRSLPHALLPPARIAACVDAGDDADELSGGDEVDAVGETPEQCPAAAMSTSAAGRTTRRAIIRPEPAASRYGRVRRPRTRPRRGPVRSRPDGDQARPSARQ